MWNDYYAGCKEQGPVIPVALMAKVLTAVEVK